MIRFGKPSEEGVDTHVIVKKLKEKGYTAAGDPTDSKASALIGQTDKIKEIRRIFEDADIMMAEIGCWGNLLDTDHVERQKNRDRMVETLAVADALGARCTVSGLGSYCHGSPNSKHSKKNFSEEAFQEAVEIARYCIDSVKPKTTFFTYQPLSFNIVDSPEMIAALVEAVNREQFGVHIDLVNMINCPRNYYNSAAIIQRAVELFGDRIVSCHIKDIKLREPSISVILEEIRPGLGELDIAAYLRALNSLPHTVPLLMEHLPNEQEYDLAAEYIRSVARAEGIEI